MASSRLRLGRALAEDLALDHDLVLTSSRPWAGETWVDGLSKTGRVRTLQWDAESPDLVSRMMADLDTLETQGWVISGAIILAGSFPESPFGTWSQKDLEATCLVPGLAQLLAPEVRVVGHALGVLLPQEGSDAAWLGSRTLLNRIGDPADLCRAVRFAAGSPFLTGEILTQDGGRRWVDR